MTATATSTVHVLVGTSPTDAARLPTLRSLAADLGADLAFLQLAAPSLGAVLDRYAAAGTHRVILVGVSGGSGGPGVSWLRRIAADWWRTHGDPAPRVATATSYLDDPAQWHQLVRTARDVTDGGPGLTSPAWQDVPGHTRQVFVCRGPRCTAAGAEGSARALVVAMMDAGLDDDDVLLTQTGCQFPCNQAPVVSVQPDDVWYGKVDEDGAAEIVCEHLVAGRPVPRLRLPRRRG